MLGVSIFDERAQSFRFHPGPIFHSVVLADEINRAPPKTQSALLEAMEEQQVSIDGQTRKLPHPFFVIATQNPVEQIGAYPLPESQLDRFLMAIELGYPDAAAERELLTGGDRRAQLPDLPALADPATLAEWQREAGKIHVAPALLDYVQALLAASRGHLAGAKSDSGARRGLSPRAGLMLLAATRAMALIHGRTMALPEDVQAVFPWVAAHRLAGGARAGQVEAQALVRTVVPLSTTAADGWPASTCAETNRRSEDRCSAAGFVARTRQRVFRRGAGRPRSGRACGTRGSTSCPRGTGWR